MNAWTIDDAAALLYQCWLRLKFLYPASKFVHPLLDCIGSLAEGGFEVADGPGPSDSRL